MKFLTSPRVFKLCTSSLEIETPVASSTINTISTIVIESRFKSWAKTIVSAGFSSKERFSGSTNLAKMPKTIVLSLLVSPFFLKSTAASIVSGEQRFRLSLRLLSSSDVKIFFSMGNKKSILVHIFQQFFMNTLLFKDENSLAFIPNDSPKGRHLQEFIKPQDGDEIFAGLVNKSLFKIKIFKTEGGFKTDSKRTPLPNPPILNLNLFLPFTRPQIAKRIFFEAACFGVKKICLYPANKGEAAYAQSSLIKNKEFEEDLIKGAEQACSSNIPEVEVFENLDSAIQNLSPKSLKIAPDLYEATQKFPLSFEKNQEIDLVFGGERGFSANDRNILRAKNFTLVSMGQRVLRTDSAIIFALSAINLAEVFI